MKIVLCDSTSINSYGFRTDVSGINLERFKKNPVMLYNHDPEKVIGKWKNITVTGNRLTAEPVFDASDPFAAEIERKVNDGFIKGCSMGLMITQITKTKGVDVATESLLLEASIVSIPSDENALVVYADEKQEKKLSINEFNKLFYNMETKEIDNSQLTVDNLQSQLKEKDSQIAELSAKIAEYEKNEAERQFHEAEDFSSKAVSDGKVPAELKADVTAMYLENKERTVRLFAALKETKADEKPALQTTLSAMVKNGAEADNTLTWDDLDRKPGALKKLKDENIEEFKRLYREKFHCEWERF